MQQCDEQLRADEYRINVQINVSRSGVLARERPGTLSHSAGRRYDNEIRILPITMQPGEELIVGNSVRRVLEKARKQSA